MQAADDLSLILEAARGAGALAETFLKHGTESWDKGGNSPVSDADLAVDAFLEERLRALRPDYGWLSEETRDDKSRLAAPRTFLVDPIDGTRDFLRGRSGWAISIAVVEDDWPIAAVLFAPALGYEYTARQGGGAALNGQPIRTSGRSALENARLCIDPDILRSRHWQGPACDTAPKPNSIALRMADVARGAADATFDGRSTNEYDTAAGALILTEAGGIITDTMGARPRYNKPRAKERDLIASASLALHEELRPAFAATLESRRRR